MASNFEKGCVCGKNQLCPLCISVGWMKHQRKCPYCLLLSKICRESVSLSYQPWRKPQLLQKKRVLFSVSFVLILFRKVGVKMRAVFLQICFSGTPWSTLFWKAFPGLTVCSLYKACRTLPKGCKRFACSPPRLESCMGEMLSEESPSKSPGQAKFVILNVAVATRAADVCTVDKQHWW